MTLRALLVLSLLGVAMAGHWFDRKGLRDNIDGEISFSDVVYFTAITVTTVGYGDIVPVSDRARMFDTFVVTPIRIFVWLLFLGTAYSFFFRSTLERIRTAMIRSKLSGHTIICGFGAKGEYAAKELLDCGQTKGGIVVIDTDNCRVEIATDLGLLGICGDATQNDVLKTARIETASSVLVAANKDDTAALVVLSARQLNHRVPISVTARAQENEDLLAQAGATFVLNPVRIGGHMLARAGAQHFAVEYLADLAAARGEVMLRQRVAEEADFDTALCDIATGVGVRLLRNGVPIGRGDQTSQKIERGDIIIEIVASGRSPDRTEWSG